MIHDTKRVESLRARTTAQLELVSTLQEKIAKGELPQLRLAHNQLGDIESFFLARLDTEERTPLEEARWLAGAEHLLQIWTAEVQKVDAQFKQFGPPSDRDYRRVKKGLFLKLCRGVVKLVRVRLDRHLFESDMAQGHRFHQGFLGIKQ